MNKMRTLLTMLGIIIGIASVIAIMTIGSAMTAQVSENLSQFGTQNINVFVREKSMGNMQMMMGGGGAMMMMGGGGARPAGAMQGARVRNTRQQSSPTNDDLISMDMIADFEETFSDEVEGVSLTYQGGSATVEDGDLTANISIQGVSPAYTLANNLTLLSGRFINDSDLDNTRSVAVVSDKLVNNMFGTGTDPLSQEIKVYKSDVIEIYTIVGIYKYELSGFAPSTSSDEDVTTNLYIPVTTSKIDLIEKNYQSITVVASKNADIYKFTDEITAYFDKVYSNNSTWGANVSSNESQLDTIMSTLSTISYAISLIAAISLLVGGIGIMNIMLVSVTERTKEIGTRKALGAKHKHIRLQFVTEAVIISVIGGLIGVVLGSVIGLIISVFIMNAPFALSVGGILICVAVSSGIGIFFGYYPANKAAKLDPIQALRYE